MKPSVLIVDDESMTRDLLRLMLERAGFDISEAEDGLQALLMVAEEVPDVLLLDVMMPNMDGLTVCEKLRAQAETAVLPIILLSARNSPESISEGMKAGATRYLGKPVAYEKLVKTIHEVLEGTPSTETSSPPQN